MKGYIGAWKQNKGFTMVELLVALAILVIAATAFVPVFAYVARSNQQNTVRMTAGNIAAGVLEEIRALPYDSIGTVNGNPAGPIPQIKTVSLGGITYTVETLITWGSAKSASAGDAENVVALKNIRVIVKAPGIFTGTAEKVDEINSIAARESEESIVKNGHIRVTLKNSQGGPITFSTEVNIVNEPPTPAINQTMASDANGRVLFGVIEAGKYTVKVKIPGNVTVLPGPGQTISGGYIVQSGVEVQDWQITDIAFCMEENSRLAAMSLKLTDSADALKAITGPGSLTLKWTYDSNEIILINNKAFSPSDFIDGRLPEAFFGSLWPAGTYSIAISGVPGYAGYDSELVTSEPPILPDNSAWDGSISSPGQKLELTVKMKAGASSYFYVEDTKADFDAYTDLQNVEPVSGDGDLLKLAYVNTVSNIAPDAASKSASSAYGSYIAGNASDNNASTYWRQDRYTSLPQWLKWDFGEEKCVGSVLILAAQSGRIPKSVSFEISNDDTVWSLAGSATLSNTTTTQGPFSITSPVLGRYFRLNINSLQSGSSSAAINEVQLLNVPGYAISGKRVSKAIPFKDPGNGAWFTSAPLFKISWSEATDASTSLSIFTAVTNSAVRPADSAFTAVTNGGVIPGIVKGTDLTGKYLWVMESMSTEDIAKSPSLDWLRISY